MTSTDGTTATATGDIDVARAHRATDSLHALVYFAPEAEEQFVGIGLRPGRMPYFASRSAPMGPVSAGVTAATFYNFNPEMIARHIPRAWTLASPEQILEARLRAVDLAYRRLLDGAVDTPAIRELAELTRAAAADLPPEGRPLFAAHAGLDWPAEPHLALWHAITLLREFRGDGHLAALLEEQLSGVEAIVTHTATGRGFTEPSAKLLRGWSDEQWAEAQDALRARGLLDADGALTAAGTQQRARLEARTDELGAAPWRSLGAERTARATELGRALTHQVAGAGAFPKGVFATPK